MGIVDEDVEYLGGALQLWGYMDVYQYHILEEVTIFKGDPQYDSKNGRPQMRGERPEGGAL